MSSVPRSAGPDSGPTAASPGLSPGTVWTRDGQATTTATYIPPQDHIVSSLPRQQVTVHISPRRKRIISANAPAAPQAGGPESSHPHRRPRSHRRQQPQQGQPLLQPHGTVVLGLSPNSMGGGPGPSLMPSYGSGPGAAAVAAAAGSPMWAGGRGGAQVDPRTSRTSLSAVSDISAAHGGGYRNPLQLPPEPQLYTADDDIYAIPLSEAWADHVNVDLGAVFVLLASLALACLVYGLASEWYALKERGDVPSASDNTIHMVYSWFAVTTRVWVSTGSRALFPYPAVRTLLRQVMALVLTAGVMALVVLFTGGISFCARLSLRRSRARSAAVASALAATLCVAAAIAAILLFRAEFASAASSDNMCGPTVPDVSQTYCGAFSGSSESAAARRAWGPGAGFGAAALGAALVFGSMILGLWWDEPRGALAATILAAVAIATFAVAVADDWMVYEVELHELPGVTLPEFRVNQTRFRVLDVLLTEEVYKPDDRVSHLMRLLHSVFALELAAAGSGALALACCWLAYIKVLNLRTGCLGLHAVVFALCAQVMCVALGLAGLAFFAIEYPSAAEADNACTRQRSLADKAVLPGCSFIGSAVLAPDAQHGTRTLSWGAGAGYWVTLAGCVLQLASMVVLGLRRKRESERQARPLLIASLGMSGKEARRRTKSKSASGYGKPRRYV
ncbi:uncharacterized protein AMSG_04389 [Thecamonas trahens ATCC 50062]|uniref:Uncharacterized protein n=1 Tax=Thecamonas trahens ATCC 50062 TaxID=461836 RepID=A0A0L0D7J2_THETB|nr:hypothetical protein AMSG_04389 [Thecamonas trahens ATCC 50062]KNC48160.1 hypothetical protein AMSG_04389 [Thecamonas trahens ATCC 50062]|eukprot:XP_013758730.1 hypothetical protein AMSG_04389 [Thecamonas trahens ATCC 50062]